MHPMAANPVQHLWLWQAKLVCNVPVRASWNDCGLDAGYESAIRNPQCAIAGKTPYGVTTSESLRGTQYE